MVATLGPPPTGNETAQGRIPVHLLLMITPGAAGVKGLVETPQEFRGNLALGKLGKLTSQLDWLSTAVVAFPPDCY